MEYTLPNTRGLTVKCGGRAYTLCEDIRCSGTASLSAQVVPTDDAGTDWQYEAHWTCMDDGELDAMLGDLSNCEYFDGIVGTITTDEEDDVVVYDAHPRNSPIGG